MDEKKAVTMDQLLESARKSEELTMQVAQAAQTEIDKLFTSVSDGKALIASAITDKGVPTEQDASFQIMKENILAIESGNNLPEGVYQINVTASTPEGGTVSGSGVASEGMTLTISANVADGYTFEGWQENGAVVSTENPYTFTANANRSFTAAFEVASQYEAGADWWGSIMPSSGGWYGVVYGLGKFVAVDSNNKIAAYSTDGISWSGTTTPVTARHVAYGNNRFVAIGTSSWGQSFYSDDGINWVLNDYRPYKSLWGITYGAGKFVVMCPSRSIALYSTDGINWTEATLPSSSNWTGVTYGGGKFVAVASNSGKVAYSTDGINWEEATLQSSAYLESVAYGGGKFVAISRSNIAVYSEDGINWAETTLPSSASWTSVAYGAGKFVAVSNFSSTKSVYSKDGINWNEVTLPSPSNWTSVTFGNGKFVAVSTNNSNKAAYSSAFGPEK